MAADKIEVLTRKAGEDAAWLWVSDGKSGYSIERAEKPSHGTIITLHLNEEGIEFADRWRIQDLVKRYSAYRLPSTLGMKRRSGIRRPRRWSRRARLRIASTR